MAGPIRFLIYLCRYRIILLSPKIIVELFQNYFDAFYQFNFIFLNIFSKICVLVVICIGIYFLSDDMCCLMSYYGFGLKLLKYTEYIKLIILIKLCCVIA